MNGPINAFSFLSVGKTDKEGAPTSCTYLASYGNSLMSSLIDELKSALIEQVLFFI